MTTVVRVLAWAVVLVLVLAVYRNARRRSLALANVLALGIVLRAALGVFLYMTSLFEWPFFPHLQSGGGFWTLAIDAQWYFNSAAEAATLGLHRVEETAPSPLYLRCFALFMRFVGVSPAAAILFNLLSYLLVAAIIIRACPDPRIALVPLSGFTFAPALLIFGSQALKDWFNLASLAVALAGVGIFSEGITRRHAQWAGAVATGICFTWCAVYALGGVRPYVAVFVIMGTGAAAIAACIGSRQAGNRLRTLLAYGVLGVGLWAGFAAGADAYYGYYDNLLKSVFVSPSAPVAGLEQARAGFVGTGGATSFAAPEPPLASSDVPLVQKGATRLSRVLVGLAAMFVPITVLKELSLVSFSGGRGLLVVTDLDTVAINIVTCACIVVFIRARRPKSLPAAACCIAVALLTTIAMAYVVTNFGTLFRLRALAVAPLWLLPALALRRAGELPSSRSGRTRDAF